MNPILSSPVPATKTSNQAVWSLVLGILSITCLWLLGAIPAIILGVLAVKNIDRSGGTLKGRGMGIAGIVTGSIGIFAGIGTVAMMSALMIPSFSGVRLKAQQVQEMSQIKQITLGCRAYAADQNGSYPADLSALVDGGYVDVQTIQPRSIVGGPYLYRAGLTDTAGGDEPLLASPAPIGTQRVIGMADGFVKTVTEEEFQAEYARHFP